MKINRLRIILPLLIIAIFCSCTYRVYHVKKMPPGHAKKVYGSKSARNHAPGHQKAHKR